MGSRILNSPQSSYCWYKKNPVLHFSVMYVQGMCERITHQDGALNLGQVKCSGDTGCGDHSTSAECFPKQPALVKLLLQAAGWRGQPCPQGKLHVLEATKWRELICRKESVWSRPMCGLRDLWNVWMLLRFFEW